MQHYIFGIDFGTSTTVISHTKDTSSFEPEIIEIDNKKTVETVIRTTSDGQQIELVGSEAWANAFAAPDRTFYEFKLKVGSGEKYPLDGVSLTADELGTLFLSHLREKIEQNVLNNETLAEISKINKVTTVIGYPAEWNEIQKKATVKMAVAAGFPNVSGCEEPLGAIYYHYYQGEIDLDKEQYILVYDFGGGTTDTAIVETKPGVDPKVHSVAGITSLGGKNYDERISAYMVEDICQLTEKDSLPNEDIVRIRRHSRQIKERLSINIDNRKEEAQETIPRLKSKNAEHVLTLNKDTFENLHSDLLEEFSEPVWDVLSKASIKQDEISRVISTGGSGRFYFVTPKLREIFPNAALLRSTNPQESIAKGLALYAKVKVCGKERVKPKTVASKNSDHTDNVSGFEQTKSGIDPYAQEAQKKKAGLGGVAKKIVKWSLLTAGVLFVVLLIAAIFSDDTKTTSDSVQKPKITLPQPTSDDGYVDKNATVINDLYELSLKIFKANDDRNISLIDAIKGQVQGIDTSGCKSEVVAVKSALVASANEIIDFSRKYGAHPYDVKWYEATISKEQDAFDQRFENDPGAVDRFGIFSAFEYYYYCLAKYFESIGESHSMKVTKYSIYITEYHCEKSIVDAQTNFVDGFGFTEGPPDVKIVISVDINEYKAILKTFPRSGSYTDMYASSVREYFTWYADSDNRLYIMLYDMDIEFGELLDYTRIPSKNYNDWLNLGSGCRVHLKVEIDATNPKR